MSTYHLIVHNPFASYQKGALISDPTEVQRILESDHHANVHRIQPVGQAAPGAAVGTEKQG